MSSLVIIEVSQKQAYIFGSNKLRDNIRNSSVIAYVTSSQYFTECAGDVYSPTENEVYCGGGHAVLAFSQQERAVAFVQLVTGDARKRFPGLELFAAVHCCGGEPSVADITLLIQKLEAKKALRRASFVQGSFGVEKLDPLTREVILTQIIGRRYDAQAAYAPDEKEEFACPAGYESVYQFGDLGVSRGKSNFIAVVHLDGNAIGKRIEGFRQQYGHLPWAEYRKKLKSFSDSLDGDFKQAFQEMCLEVAGKVKEGKIGEVELKQAKNGRYYFPIRRIISEGDDICFVTEGSLGIECARIYAECLAKRTNAEDGQSYGVCAGVAIVHQKYPFAMAYELSEMLCANAKRFVAETTENAPSADASGVCAVDWHIEYGELGENMESIRRQYRTAEGKSMELRPYVLSGSEEYLKQEWLRSYGRFKQVMAFLDKKDDYARGKIKELRRYLGESEEIAWNYIRSNRIEPIVRDCYLGNFAEVQLNRIGSGQVQEQKLFVETSDKKQRCILYDGIELIDVFVAL